MADDHWPVHARRWRWVGPPLRPTPDDVALVERELARLPNNRALRVLLLGVTPELATLRWPERTRLVAVDRCAGMIELVWPKHGVPRDATAVQADWRALPLDDASVDLVLGDGCLSVFSFPSEYEAALREIRRVTAPAGELWLRLFVPPPEPESLDRIRSELEDGLIDNFHILKWRILMAVQRGPHASLGEAFRAFESLCEDREAWSRRFGWTPETLGTIDTYRDAAGSYSFPTMRALEPVFSPHFAVRAVHEARYPMGERCPTVMLTAR